MTIEAGALALRISEQGADAVLAKLNTIDAKAKALGQATQSVAFNAPSATSINGQLGQMSTNFSDVTKAANTAAPALEKQAVAQAKVAATAKAVGAESAGLGRAAAGFAGITAGLAAIGVTLTGGAILSGIANMTRNAIDAGDALHDLKMRTGVSTEALSVLQQVAAKSGADGGVLTVGFRNLSKMVEKLREGNKQAVATFAALGLGARDFEGLSLDQVFVKIADAQEKFADGSGKTATMVQLFGRAGDQLLPTLHELADGGFDRARAQAERFGAVVSDEFANKADAFNDTLVDMEAAVGGLGIAIANVALPQMTAMAEMLTTLISKGREWMPLALGIAGRTVLAASGPLGWMALWKLGKMKNEAMRHGALDSDPTLDALLTGPPGKDKPDVRRDLLGAKETAAERERRRLLEKAMDVSMLGLGNLRDSDTAMEGGTRADPQLVGVDSKGKMKGLKDQAAKIVDPKFDAIAERIQEKQRFLQSIIQESASAVGSAFGNAFTAAFQGGNFFAELGKSLIASIGGMIMQLGESMLTYGTLMALGAPLLMATPFAAQAMSAPAAIAGGIGLIALGAAMGAVGGGKGKGGGGGGKGGGSAREEPNEFAVAFDPDRKLRGGSAVAPSARSIDSSPMPDARPVVNIGVINSLDSDNTRWQRELVKTYDKARSRGVTGR